MSPIACYLADLDAALRGSRRQKRDLLQEAHDHLDDARDALIERGVSREAAELRAVREFGTVTEIAPPYQAILSASQGRRIGMSLIAVVLFQPLAWDVWHAGGGQTGSANALTGYLGDYVEWTGMTSLLLAVLTVVASGIGLRFLGAREWVLRFGFISAAGSSLLICLISAGILVANGSVSATHVLAVVAIAWIPFGLVATTSLRALRAVDHAGEPQRA